MASNESTKGYIFATHVRLSNIQNVLFLYGFRYYLLGGPQSPEGQSNIREFNLGKGAENQNGNLRWHLPWRGGGLEGVSFAIKLFWKMIFLKTI